jgi:hypothetical protein
VPPALIRQRLLEMLGACACCSRRAQRQPRVREPGPNSTIGSVFGPHLLYFPSGCLPRSKAFENLLNATATRRDARLIDVAVQAERLNGGYRSVTRTNAYAATRLCQRRTPWTKSKMPRGYLPVNTMANQAATAATIAAM